LSSSAQPIEGATGKKAYGTGRRKNAVARVFVSPGSGKFEVNGRAVAAYFPNVAWLTRAVEPLKFTGMQELVDVWATANGGGVGGQSGAVRMGLSRALSVFNAELRPGLRKNGFLTRDSRMRERKKYGQKGARKRFQFSKR
jgi:small subunit ribosomal protein S9